MEKKEFSAVQNEVLSRFRERYAKAECRDEKRKIKFEYINYAWANEKESIIGEFEEIKEDDCNSMFALVSPDNMFYNYKKTVCITMTSLQAEQIYLYLVKKIADKEKGFSICLRVGCPNRPEFLKAFPFCTDNG